MYYLNKVTELSIYPNITTTQLTMLVVAIVLMVLALRSRAQSILLLPIALGIILANVPGSTLALNAVESALVSANNTVLTDIATSLNVETLDPRILASHFSQASITTQQQVLNIVELAGFRNGLLFELYQLGVASGVAPLFIFLALGAMSNLSALLIYPRLILVGVSAQLSVVLMLLLMAALASGGVIPFKLAQLIPISLMASADAALITYLGYFMTPSLVALFVLITCVCIALLNVVQKPTLYLLSTEQERSLSMPAAPEIERWKLQLLPVIILISGFCLLPLILPLLAMFCLGNLLKESDLSRRLSDVAQGPILGISFIVLGLAVGSQLNVDMLIHMNTMWIFLFTLLGICLSTVIAIISIKILNLFSATPLNPILGVAGVAVLPVSAHISQRIAQENNKQHQLLLYAVAVNVVSLITALLIAGVYMSYFS